jgi:hypothetical protein
LTPTTWRCWRKSVPTSRLMFEVACFYHRRRKSKRFYFFSVGLILQFCHPVGIPKYDLPAVANTGTHRLGFPD